MANFDKQRKTKESKNRMAYQVNKALTGDPKQ
jgi:hypothetical protein